MFVEYRIVDYINDIGYIGVIDNQGSIYIYEDRGDNQLSLFRTFQHEATNSFGLEESWCMLAFSPSGKRVGLIDVNHA